ncbi:MULTISPECIES: Fe-S cluster assembly sulfur transfer protein SufU [unclassified Butyrivibrio]|uniref:Fe-S cluster assembly sulfur transfer protein SufU n=1 Tax=unclassified Butyrivibrio TaxID=2639466 RepID=UPI0003B41BC9|nr:MULTISPECIES: SUF system NifU family Fe-S cluster assembly protein [unclassified Butyrivibrio]MDC7292157.1 SUF system NifU family Fe-S cluster assembly protein [Butyrivibrio sp. DSM 10294]
MELKQLYREIVNEHNLHPVHKGKMEAPDLVLRGVNPSCGDDITLSLKIVDGKIADAMYEGSGCAISQASVDMMADQVIGRTKEDAIKLAGTFMGMIKGEVTDEASLEELDEAAALQDVAHMPARVKCAVLGWHTMQEMLENPEKAQG